MTRLEDRAQDLELALVALAEALGLVRSLADALIQAASAIDQGRSRPRLITVDNRKAE